MTPWGERVIAAIEAHRGLVAPAIKQLMAEAWEEGATAAIEREHAYGREEKAKYANPYVEGPDDAT